MRVLNVENLIENQSQKHRERLVSQFSRLTDSNPSFVRYYSIDGVNSTAELGTRDIMQYVGDDSPVQFKRVEGVPLFARNPITSEVVYDESLGSYTSFSDEALINVSVIRPLPGDHFVDPDFNPEVIFIITETKIRAIRGEDHYQISFSVVPTSRLLNIERQVTERYKTIFRNIGTEDTVLIKEQDYNLLNECVAAYSTIQERYLNENLDTDIAYLKTPDYLDLDGCVGYGTCKYLIRFLMENRVIYFDEILESIFAFETVLPFQAKHNINYSRSFPLHKFLKRKIVKGTQYVTFRALPMSLFREVSNELMEQSIEFKFSPGGSTHTPDIKEFVLYTEEFTDIIIDKDYDNATPMEKVIAKFVNDEDITIEEFMDIIDDYDVTDLFRFYFIPLILVILKVKIKALQKIGNN